MNEDWHREHVLPKNPSLDERIRWHQAHAENCGCRPIPDGILNAIAKRDRSRT